MKLPKPEIDILKKAQEAINDKAIDCLNKKLSKKYYNGFIKSNEIIQQIIDGKEAGDGE